MIGLAPRAAPQRGWIAVAAAWGVGLTAWLTWALTTPASALRGQLSYLQFWSLETCVYLGLALSAAVLHELRGLFHRRDLVGMLLLMALAVGLTTGMAPRTHRVFYDELIYQNIGQNLAASRRALMCNDGTIQSGRLQCAIGEYNKQPYAYPHLLSLAYRFFGVRETAAFVVNAVAIGLCVGALCLVVLMLFADRVAAFFAALLLALTPQQLVWSATAAVEPTASLACVGALLATACFLHSRSAVSLAGAAVAAAYAIQFRPESLLIVPVVALLIAERAPEEIARPRLWWAGLLFLALAAVPMAHIMAVRNEGWGTTGERLSFAYAVQNSSVNGRFYLGDARFPMAYTLLALLGLFAWRGAKGRAALAFYFLLFFGITLFFYAGSYDYGTDVRYSLATYPSVMILAGLGAAWLVHRVAPRSARRGARLGLAAVLVIAFFWMYAPGVRVLDDSAWAARADVEFARSLVDALKGDSYVFTHNPGMFQVWGVNAGQMSLAAANPARVDDVAERFPGGIYLHWNFWCNVQDPVQRDFCVKVLAARPGEPIREHSTRDQHYVLYRLAARAPQR